MAITAQVSKKQQKNIYLQSTSELNGAKKKHGPLVLDLFAGAGGLSEGFVEAGCEMVSHIEMDKNACSTLTTRTVYHALKRLGEYEVYKEYLKGSISLEEIIRKYGLETERDSVIYSKISEENYLKLIEDVRLKLKGRRLDMIVGGPPCQAYSYIGRARDVAKMHTDERNFLYQYYVAFLKALKPKIFVFENVPGLLTAGGGKYLTDMQRLMKEVGYESDFRILNAADYGVPQNRKRIILVGWSNESRLKKYPEFNEVNRDYMVQDFLNDLPPIKPGDNIHIKKRKIQNDLLIKLGVSSEDMDFTVDHITRPHIQRDLEIYRLAVRLKNKGINLKYNNLPADLKTHKNEKGFLDRFKVVDAAARGSHTVVAHIGKDGHFYIHPDLQQNRSLSVREAARLQTFPDDYKFEGSRGPKYKQIGNAVPPMLAKVIATELCRYV
jgi:DNA (cytosine-5)-methyltransferase 1